MSMQSGAWSIATIEVALKVENGIHTPMKKVGRGYVST